MDNLLDRINSYIVLHPLTFKETRAMINYRLALCTPIGKPTPRLLTGPAFYAIHRATKGYPRKTVRLCHKIILNLLIRKKKCAGMGLVRSVVKEELSTGYRCRPVAVATAGVALLLVLGLGAVRYVPEVRSMAQGIQSAVASTFAEAPEKSPFAPVQNGPVVDDSPALPSTGTTEVDASPLEQEGDHVTELDASRDGSMTLDEYFSEGIEAEVASDAADLATNKATTSEAAKGVVEPIETGVEAPVTSPVMEEVRVTRYEPLNVNADKAAHALGVVKAEPDAPKKQTTGMVAVKSNPAPVSAPALQSVSVGDNDKPAEIGEYYELPTQMGRLPVMPQESLSVIIRKVYGVYDQANLRQVIAANPGLRNVNDIVVGQPLIFPVINPGNRQLDQSLSWLCFSVERRLDKAYGRLRAATLFGFDSRLLPYVAADGALAFAVVMERPFQTAEEAEIERGCLPLALQKEASIMRTPNPDVSLAQMNDLATNVLQAKLTQ